MSRSLKYVGTLVAVLLAGAGLTVLHAHARPVHLASGVKSPLRVEIDGKPLEVPPLGHTTTWLTVGAHHLRVTSAAGKLLDERTIGIPLEPDVVALNLLGAAPLFTASIVYSQGGGEGGGGGYDFHGGRAVVVEENSDYTFTDPPSSISVSDKQRGPTVKRHFDVAPNGWPVTVQELIGDQRYREALDVLRRVDAATAGADHASDYARHLLSRIRGEAGVVRSLEPLLDDRDVENQRTIQYYERLAGLMERSRARARAYSAAHPTDVEAVALQARVEHRETAERLYRQVLAADPRQLLAVRGLAYVLSRQGRCGEALPYFEQAARAEPDEHRYVDDHARCLVRENRAADALKLIAAVPQMEADQAVLHARIAEQAGLPAADRYFSQVTARGYVAGWLASSCARPMPPTQIPAGPPSTRAAVLVQQAALRGPAEAWIALSAAPRESYGELTPALALLLGLEFTRVGDTARGSRLLDASATYIALPPRALTQYVDTGVEDPDLWRLDPELRAALELVRARRVESGGAAATAIYARVQDLDVITGFVTVAARKWEHPHKESP